MSEVSSNSKIPKLQAPPVAPRRQSLQPAIITGKHDTQNDPFDPQCLLPCQVQEIEDSVSPPKRTRKTLTTPSQRKTKTIFSMERGSQIETGGTGDGDHPPRKKLTVMSIPSEDELEKTFPKICSTTVAQILSSTEDEDYQVDDKFHSIKEKVRTTNVKGTESYIIKCVQEPTLSSTDIPIYARECKAILPKSSTLILERSNDFFSGSVLIQNFTPLVYGFKAMCRANAISCINLNPSEGVVPPGGIITVSIEAKTKMQRLIEMASGESIDIKTFPISCLEKSELDNLQTDVLATINFLEPRTDQLRTQQIKRVILWDAGDLSTVPNLLSSIEDVREKSIIKEELYSKKSRAEKVSPVRSLRFIRSIKRHALGANHKCGTIGENLSVIKKSQCWTNIISVILIILLFLSSFKVGILEYRMAEVRALLETEREMSLWERWLRMLESVFKNNVTG